MSRRPVEDSGYRVVIRARRKVREEEERKKMGHSGRGRETRAAFWKLPTPEARH